MKRYPYFEHGKGIAFYEADTKKQIRIITNRFVGDNPPLDYTARIVSHNGFIKSNRIKLTEKLGTGKDGYSLVCGYISSEVQKIVDLSVLCYAPVRIFANEEEIFHSDFNDEISDAKPRKFEYTIKQGLTFFTIACRRTVAGFGCEFSLPVTLLSPFAERRGMAGWVFTELLESCEEELLQSLIRQVMENKNEAGTGIKWFPELGQNAGETPQTRLFSVGKGYCVSWSTVHAFADKQAIMYIDSKGTNEIYVNGMFALTCETGMYELELPGHAIVHIKSLCSGKDFGANLSIENGFLVKPYAVNGTESLWLYSGCFETDFSFPFDDSAQKLMQQFQWQVDGNQLYIKRFYEGSYNDKWWVASGGTAYGRWDYPVGVTLQGLLQTADATENEELRYYIQNHILQCVDSYAEACRNKEIYGNSSFISCLVSRKTLDDFGAMGAAMLECSRRVENPTFRGIADDLWEIIQNNITYLPNGAYYRNESDTLWADDLYMGTSFLGRYYEMFGVKEALDLAARQFLAFAELLYIPEYQIFSHVYDVKRGIPTGIAWGRGNGWVLYSLSEILERMPVDHKLYNDLLSLYRKLCEGYLKLQDGLGYWHQVLTDHDSYEETSCTAMFVYAFSKGVRNGWFADNLPYETGARNGWRAISSYSVDRRGNVHAVCKGSGFSFTKEYYKNDLYWVTNDNHGTGIVLLAGCEFLRMLGLC